MLVMLLQHGFYISAGILLGLIHGGLTMYGHHYFRNDDNCVRHVWDLSAYDLILNTIIIAVLGFWYLNPLWGALFIVYLVTYIVIIGLYFLFINAYDSATALLDCARRRQQGAH